MATATLQFAGDVTGSGWTNGNWSWNGGGQPDSAAAVLNAGWTGVDGDSYWLIPTNTAVSEGLTFGGCLSETIATPPDSTFNVCTDCSIVLRAEVSSSKHSSGSGFECICYQSDETTALTNTISTGTITTSWANYTLTMTLAGSQTLTAWTNAQLWIGALNGYSVIDYAAVTLTYTQTTGGGGGCILVGPTGLPLIWNGMPLVSIG